MVCTECETVEERSLCQEAPVQIVTKPCAKCVVIYRRKVGDVVMGQYIVRHPTPIPMHDSPGKPPASRLNRTGEYLTDAQERRLQDVTDRANVEFRSAMGAIASTGITVGCPHRNTDPVVSLDIEVARLCLDCGKQLETAYTREFAQRPDPGIITDNGLDIHAPIKMETIGPAEGWVVSIVACLFGVALFFLIFWLPLWLFNNR